VLVEQQIRALKAEGFSVREIARELGLSRMKVHRVLAAPPATAVPVSAELSESGQSHVAPDPILSLLTEADMAHLHVEAADVAAGLDALTRYRMMGLPPGSAAGDAARALFDSSSGR
jgi:Homeodomain-like domain